MTDAPGQSPGALFFRAFQMRAVDRRGKLLQSAPDQWRRV
ncbi:hypothetical protein XACM_3436 [Xanthomonas euvesicatoria pv. citrumelo F1]|nr:hypothetical protein XACM_3436 [Xanthomonas euvesicatoria pv. citrumelo F1]